MEVTVVHFSVQHPDANVLIQLVKWPFCTKFSMRKTGFRGKQTGNEMERKGDK